MPHESQPTARDDHREGERTGGRRRLLLGIVIGALVASGLNSALAAELPPPAPEPYPSVAFVARNDVPFDSLAVGPVAGALGGIIVITPPTRLSDAAREAITAYGPEFVILVGGEGALSADVATAVADAGTWDVRRVAGAGRDQTAAEVAAILGGAVDGIDAIGRPVLTSNGSGQVVGDVYIGGKLTVDSLEVINGSTGGGDADTIAGVPLSELSLGQVFYRNSVGPAVPLSTNSSTVVVETTEFTLPTARACDDQGLTTRWTTITTFQGTITLKTGPATGVTSVVVDVGGPDSGIVGVDGIANVAFGLNGGEGQSDAFSITEVRFLDGAGPHRVQGFAYKSNAGADLEIWRPDIITEIRGHRCI